MKHVIPCLIRNENKILFPNVDLLKPSEDRKRRNENKKPHGKHTSVKY